MTVGKVMLLAYVVFQRKNSLNGFNIILNCFGLDKELSFWENPKFVSLMKPRLARLVPLVGVGRSWQYFSWILRNLSK